MSYLTQLQANNTSLQACIDKANALPDAGSNGGSSDSFTNVTVNFSWSATSSDYTPEVFYSMADKSGNLVGNTYCGNGASGTTTLTIAKNSMICIVPKYTVLEMVGVNSYTVSSGIESLYNAYNMSNRYGRALFFIRDNGNLTVTITYNSSGGSND